jgi:ADP-ribose diphosphatase
MNYHPTQPPGHPIASDPYLTLMAGDDGVGFVHCGDGVLVVPLTSQGKVLLVVEHSAALGGEVLSLAGGEVEKGESLEDTAGRELQEELSYRAGRMDYLGELHPFKYLASRQFVFLARDLEPHRLEGDEIYPVSARAVSIDEVPMLVTTGQLHDALAIAGLCLAREVLEREGKERAE